LINQYRVTLQSRKSLDNGWHRLRVEVKIAKGKAEVERLYLATLKPVMPTAAMEAYREGMNWLFLLAIVLCAVIVALAAAIAVIAVKRAKKA
jgi:cell division protein FtsL